MPANVLCSVGNNSIARVAEDPNIPLKYQTVLKITKDNNFYIVALKSNKILIV